MLKWLKGLKRPAALPAGTHVRIVGHSEWPDGTPAVIRIFPGFISAHRAARATGTREWLHNGLVRVTKGRRGRIYSQWVEFDRPTDDGSGDGPYRQAEVDITYLRADP
ncbi:MAG: hypothetical protein KF678_02905 [Phycisphaeraceae bacterium]|nr:hypothetical protein [Phycisphaeraceae bacterium]